MGIGLGIQTSEVCMKPNFPIWLLKNNFYKMSFDGVNDAIESHDDSSYWNRDEYSISFWLNMPSDPGGSQFFGHFGCQLECHPLFQLHDSTNASKIGCDIYSGDGSSGDNSKCYNYTDIEGDAHPDDTVWRNQWNLFVFTWNKDVEGGKLLAFPGVVGYLNDVQTQKDDNISGSARTTTQVDGFKLAGSASSISAPNDNFIIGGYVGALSGLSQTVFAAAAFEMSHFAFYDRALSDEEILNLKTGLEPKDLGGCLHTWKFHQGGPETAEFVLDKGSAAQSVTNFTAINDPSVIGQVASDFNYPNDSLANG